jgi:hypothetical protein
MVVNYFKSGLKKPANTAASARKTNNARKATPKRNTRNATVLGNGARVRNVTNTVKSLGTRAVALGGAAYKMYLVTPTAELLRIAAVCFVIIYIASAFLGQGTSPQIRLLKANIKNAERSLVQKRKIGMNIYRAYMKKGNVNKAANYMRQLNEKHAPNSQKIDDMKDELADLRRQIARVAPPSFSQVIQNTINALTPMATTLLALQAQISDTQTKVITAETAQQKARTEAELVSLQVAQATQELKIQQKVQTVVGPVVGGVKVLASGVQSIEALGSNMGALRRAGQFAMSTGAKGLAYGASAAGAVGRFRARRAGQA